MNQSRREERRGRPGLAAALLPILLVLNSGCALFAPANQPAGEPANPGPPPGRIAAGPTTGASGLHWTPTGVTKPVSFAVLEDYDKGADLTDVAEDFALLNELEVGTMRCSFGWDDYEPERGKYDFGWLEPFADLAERHHIRLRPYIGYTPEWAGAPGADDQAWNNPPASQADWEAFVGRLVSALREHESVVSYEIYNEENVAQWWDGSVEQYTETLRSGSAAVRKADPRAQVLFGGMVFPDQEWLEKVDESAARAYDITPFHAYPETWTPDSVHVENYLDEHYRTGFVGVNDSLGGGKPIWINETGFATVPGKSERDQANWWARAVATFLSDPHVQEIGIYEIKDLAPCSATIGNEANYHLGITRVDRTKKLAFYTLDLLTDLLDTGTITTADGELSVVESGRGMTGSAAANVSHAADSLTASGTDAAPAASGNDGLHAHLFRRPDGKQVLFVWDNKVARTVDLSVRERASTAVSFALDGSSSTAGFDGRTLRGIRLVPGEVRIFRLDP